MLKELTIDGRPASVMFMDDDFNPVDQDQATMVKAHFLDERGGVLFMRRDHAEMRAQRAAERATEAAAAQKAARLRSQWSRERARALALLEKEFIQDPKTGLMMGSTPGPGGDDKGSGRSGGKGKKSDSPHAKNPKSASALLRIPVGVSADDIISKVPGAAAEIRGAKAKLAKAVSTDGLVSEGGFKLRKGPGNWTPSRRVEHNRIRRDLMSRDKILAATPKPGEQPVLYIFGGRGGSGKSWFTKKGPLKGLKALYLNNDDIKERLPGWEGWNAGPVHEESSELGKEMEKAAREMGLNTIIDGTLQSKASTVARIEKFKAAGYRIEGYYMYASPQTAAERAVNRFMEGQNADGKGRYVAPELPLSSISNEDSFDSVRDQMDHWEIYDNDDPSFKPTLHSHSAMEKAANRPTPVKNYKPKVHAWGTASVQKVRDDKWVKQSSIKTMDDVIVAAPIAQRNLVEAASKIAADLDVAFKDPGPKTKNQKGIDRTKTKIEGRKGVAARVTDTARGAFIIKHPAEADRVIEALAKTHEVLAEDFRMIDDSYYVDRAILFRDRDTGLIGEIQIMDSRMWDAKKIGGEIYDKIRELPKSDPRYIEGSRKMREEIYGPVLDEYQKDDWKILDERSRI